MDSRNPCRIALVEHDPAIAVAVMQTLRGAGHVCHRYATAVTALRELDDTRFDLLMVERMLPDIAPARMMTAVRARIGFTIPVIALAPAEDIEAIVGALHDGADDCLGRPVPPALLLAHIAAARRRAALRSGRVEAAIGHLRFLPDGSKVHVDGQPVVLTGKEYALALLLCRNVGTPLSRADILAALWGEDMTPATRTLDVHVSRLRTKLALRPDRGFLLSALYGHGYQLDYTPPLARVPPVSRPRSASPSAQPAAASRP